jgi:6-phospho-beta-glucosidase
MAADATPSRPRRVVTLLGGGSAFVPALLEAVRARAGLLAPLEIRLWGRDRGRLAAVARFGGRRLRSDRAAEGIEVVAAPELDEALRGSDLVVNQVRVGGFAARSHDATFPLRFDLPGDETIGPGGLANALRTVPVVLELARRMERLAPDAPLLQLSNPMGIVVGALARATRLRVFGLCELPQDTLARAAALVGARGPLESDYVGMNHQGFFTSIRAGGQELLPAIARALPADGGWFGVDGAFVARERCLPLRYLRNYFSREQVVAQAQARHDDRGRELARLADALFVHYESGDGATLPPELGERDMPWHALAIVPALGALLRDEAAELYLSSPNRGAVPFLPDTAVVEQRQRLDARGAAPSRTRGTELSAPLRALLVGVADFETKAVEAALTGAREPAREALLAHPFAISAATADALLPELFDDMSARAGRSGAQA